MICSPSGSGGGGRASALSAAVEEELGRREVRRGGLMWDVVDTGRAVEAEVGAKTADSAARGSGTE